MGQCRFATCETGKSVKIFTSLLLAVVVTACGGTLAPTESLEPPPPRNISYHIVGKGETLYSIAWRYGKDYRQLAAINGIGRSYEIFPGQKLRLRGEAAASQVSIPSSGSALRASAKRAPSAVKRTVSANKRSKSLTSKKKSPPPASAARHAITWHWPSNGRILSRFRSGSAPHKGVDIAGQKGEPVLAAADGTVIYAGSALRGYGNLLIIKHTEEYLSAYAHNDRLLVGEGERIKAGQKIAELGSSGTDRNKLHFEIRRNGNPVDPMAYLRPR